MANRKRKWTAGIWVPIDGVDTLWYEVDQDGNTTYYLPEDITDPIIDKINENIGTALSRYAETHEDSALWEYANEV